VAPQLVLHGRMSTKHRTALLPMWERRQRGYHAMEYRVIPQASGLFDPDD